MYRKQLKVYSHPSLGSGVTDFFCGLQVPSASQICNKWPSRLRKARKEAKYGLHPAYIQCSVYNGISIKVARPIIISVSVSRSGYISRTSFIHNLNCKGAES